MVRTLLLAVCGVLLVGVPALRCDELPEAGGTEPRVRVTAPSLFSTPLIGDLVAVESDALLVRTEQGAGGPQRVARSAVKRFEVSRGRKSRVGEGAAIGFGIGAGLGALFGIRAYEETDSFTSRGQAMAVFGALLGGGGAALGAIFGLQTKAERWQLANPDHLRVTLVPVARRGVGLSLRLSWGR